MEMTLLNSNDLENEIHAPAINLTKVTLHAHLDEIKNKIKLDKKEYIV